MGAKRDEARERGGGGLRELHDCGLSGDCSALATQIHAEHQAAQAAAETAVAHALRAGELLLQAKAALPHGRFGAWLRRSFAFSERTARGYMQLAGLDPAKRQRVADMSLRRALAEIAEPAAPPQADSPAEPAESFAERLEHRSRETRSIYDRLASGLASKEETASLLARLGAIVSDDTILLEAAAIDRRAHLERKHEALRYRSTQSGAAPFYYGLPPLDGTFELSATLDPRRLVVISPAAEHAGFYFVDCIDTRDWIAEGWDRPVAREYVAVCLASLGVPADTGWMRHPITEGRSKARWIRPQPPERAAKCIALGVMPPESV